jgi:hypothetical protein
MLHYSEMAADSRVWVYQSNRVLSSAEITEIRKRGELFINNWTAHKQALMACFDVYYNWFIVIMVDEQQAKASGCSIDKSITFLKEMEKEYKINFFDRLKICYIKDEKVLSCDISEFEPLIAKGEINGNTFVFNNLIRTKEDLECNWRIPLKESWHKKFVD